VICEASLGEDAETHIPVGAVGIEELVRIAVDARDDLDTLLDREAAGSGEEDPALLHHRRKCLEQRLRHLT
jgi:hypothetical protein